MRYQRVSPESVPLGNGRKSNSKTTSDDDDGYTVTCTTSRSPIFKTQDPQNLSGHHQSSPIHNGALGSGGGGSGDGLLQWGHKKRSRISRTEIRESVQAIHKHKMRRRASGLVSATATTTTMQPPHPLITAQSLRNGIAPIRNTEEQSSVSLAANGSASSRNGGGSRSAAGKRSLVFSSSNGTLVHMEGGGGAIDYSPSQQLQAKNTSVVPVAENKVVLECPRIYLTLSRKEKEDDFLAMKGTKLPQRPKKRPKNIDKALQYCYPGMWLSDLTRSRYEVREKKSVKKQQQQKRRGLKGMESLDSDSYQ